MKTPEQPDSTQITDEGFRKAVESVSPEGFARRTDALINEFLINTAKRPEAETPVPQGAAYGSLAVTHKGSSASQFTSSDLAVRLGNDKDIYRVTLSSRKKIGTDIFESGNARFVHERWTPGRGTRIKERFEGPEALEKTIKLFSDHRFITR